MPTKAKPVAIRLRVQCPHCDGPANARTSIAQGRYHREIYYQCSNLFCGCAFVATLETTRIVTPSANPNPDVRLPMLQRGTHLPITGSLADNDPQATGPPSKAAGAG